jgi:hypothetical protein
MKKYVFYPILFAINPVLLLYAINISDVPASVIFPVILVCPLITLGLMWLINKYIKNIQRTGFIVFLFLLWFFYYVPFRVWVNKIHIGSISIGSHWIILPIWTLFFLFLSSNFLWQRIKSPETITMFLNIACIIMITFSIFRISTNLIPRFLVHQDLTREIQSFTELRNKTNLPDIYYIILDGYAREDVLKEIYHFDNSSFIQALKDRGFYIAPQSQSNYIQTILSLASSLNMEYLSGSPNTVPNKGLLMGLINHSRTRAFLEDVGYKYVAFSTAYPPTDLTNVDYYFSPPQSGKSHDLEALLLINTPLNPFIELGWIKAPITQYSAGQARVNNIFTSLVSEVPSIDGPIFVFAHIIAPHPPFIFDQNGPVTPDKLLFLQGSDTFQGSLSEYKQAYISDVMYINKQVIQSIDGILTNSKTPPIIIVQADHGPDAYMDWNSGKSSCMKERFSILNAYYLPNQNSIQIPEDITPVNTFPVIFNAYFGTHFDISQNHQYFATWENPFPFTNVTEISQAPCKVP